MRLALKPDGGRWFDGEVLSLWLGRSAAVVGALMMVIGALLPWATASVGTIATLSRSGVATGDGWSFIIAAVLGAAIGSFSIRGFTGLGRGVCLLAVGLVAEVLIGVEFTNVRNTVLSAGGAFFDMGTQEVGAGIYVMAFGAAAIFLGGANELLRHLSRPQRSLS